MSLASHKSNDGDFEVPLCADAQRFIVPDWETFFEENEELFAALSDTEKDELANYHARKWVDILQAQFGEEYWVSESPNFWLLCARSKEECRQILIRSEQLYAKLKTTLRDIAPVTGNGKTPILIFEGEELYYEYISEYFSDGEHARSGGVFLNRGYGHFALPFTNLHEVFATIAHELTHSELMMLQLPPWVEEGVAQLCQETLIGHIPVNRDTIKEHAQTFWNAETLEEFWNGDSFDRQDEGQTLSYHLAQFIARKLNALSPEKFAAFVREANREDAGESALEANFGLSLAELAEEILGE